MNHPPTSRPSLFSHVILPSLILAGGIGAAAAEDMGNGLNDFRLVASALATDYDYTASGDILGVDTSNDGSGEWDEAWRAGIVVQRLNISGDSGLGLSSGLGIFYSRFQEDEDDDNEERRFEALSAQLRIGLGLAVTNMMHIEILPFGGVGAARGKLGDVDSGDADLYWEYGIEAGAYVTFSSLQIGAHAGWMESGFDLEFDDESEFEGAPLDNVELEIRQSGPYVGVSLGTRF